MKFSAFFVLLLTMAITGCCPISRRLPAAVHDFGPALRGSAQFKPSTSPVSAEAPEWLKDPRIRYRLLYADPTQVRFYADDLWLAPPPALLAQRLAAAGVGRTHRLLIWLTEFEQIFDARDRAHIVLRFSATAVTPTSGQDIGEREFAYALPSPSPDAKGAVRAFASAMDRAAVDLEAWLASLPDRPAAQPR